MDQPRPMVMDWGILRIGTPNKLRQGQQDTCHLTILSQVKVNSVFRSYKEETSLMIRKYMYTCRVASLKILSIYFLLLLEYKNIMKSIKTSLVLLQCQARSSF